MFSLYFTYLLFKLVPVLVLRAEFLVRIAPIPDHCLLVETPAIKKMIIGGQKVPEIPLIPSARGTSWKLENKCMVSLKYCRSGENAWFPWQPVK